MKLTNLALHLVTCITVAVGISTDTYSATTVFHYRVNQSDEAGLPDVPSVAGDDGIADDGLEFDSDIPTQGVPAGAGNRSIDGAGVTGINSANIIELDNGLIAEEGGFTYETWFNWSGFGDINSIIDYAGTEKLVIDVNQGSGFELRMRINSDGGLDSFIAEVEPETWYYTAVVFDTQGNELAEDLSITGTFDLYLDGELVDTTDELTITEFGDSLGRSIGVSKHPLAFPRDFFEGLVYEPRVSLGALSQQELLYVSTQALPGDFDQSGVLDVDDINSLTVEAASGNNTPAFDLNNDSLVNADDVNIWVKDLKSSWIGDANVDGEFNSADLVAVFQAGKFELPEAATWSEGDWNADGNFNSGDLVVAFQDGGFEMGPRPAVKRRAGTKRAVDLADFGLRIVVLAAIVSAGFR